MRQFFAAMWQSNSSHTIQEKDNESPNTSVIKDDETSEDEASKEHAVEPGIDENLHDLGGESPSSTATTGSGPAAANSSILPSSESTTECSILVQQMQNAVQEIIARLPQTTQLPSRENEQSPQWWCTNAAPSTEEIRKQLTALSERLPELERYPADKLQKNLLAFFQKQRPWNELVMIFYQQTPQSLRSRPWMPVANFVTTVLNNPPELWDSAWELFQMETAEKQTVAMEQSRGKILCGLGDSFGYSWRGGTSNRFVENGWPSIEEFYRAYERITVAVNANKPQNGFSEKFEKSEAKKNQSLHAAFVAMLTNISTGIDAIRYLDVPITKQQLISIYNVELEKFVATINAALERHGYTEAKVNFNAIRIPEPISNQDGSVSAQGELPTPTVLLKSVTTDPFSAFTPIPSNDVLKQVRRLEEKYPAIVDVDVPASFRPLVNNSLVKRFEVGLGGKGKTSTIFMANVSEMGPRFLLPMCPPGTDPSLYNILFGASFERETKENPNLKGRMIVFSEVGKKMQELLKNSQSPTYEATILQEKDEQNVGPEYVAMTSAGNRTMQEALAQQIVPNETMLQSSIIAQVFAFIIGQLDGHPGNLMMDESGVVKVIDAGLSQPPWPFGDNETDLVKNFATALHENDNKYSQVPVDECISWLTKDEKTPIHSNTLVQLPPLTNEIATMLRWFVSQDGRQWMQDLLTKNNFTEKEKASCASRLDSAKRQLQNVQIVEEGKYMELWEQENSPLTMQNCLMRKILCNNLQN
ncbi:MAG: hypothetical protein LBP65_02380 [Puniceicoccales bacterium]|nr:hypothetical protein [Puniceicoccales bacterium]